MQENIYLHRAQTIINNLNANTLRSAISNAKSNYYFGTDKKRSGEQVAAKNIFTFGISTIFRVIKATQRLPNTKRHPLY